LRKLVEVAYPACWALQQKEITAKHLRKLAVIGSFDDIIGEFLKCIKT